MLVMYARESGRRCYKSQIRHAEKSNKGPSRCTRSVPEKMHHDSLRNLSLHDCGCARYRFAEVKGWQNDWP